MTLLLTVFAAVTVTAIWYTSPKARQLNIGLLCYMFWGASLMWMCDAVFEYMELRAAYFTPAVEDMINDTFLGLTVIAFSMLVWIISLLVKDPLNTVKASIKK